MAEIAELPDVEGMARRPRGGTSYAAFISYRHGVLDTRWASRILILLETYKVPKALQRQGYPTRLGRVFRDVEELTAASDLDDNIKSALERSDNLIVICSPETPASRWVGQEIAYFKALGKGNRIFPVLIGGKEEDAFHPELLSRTVREPDDDGVMQTLEVPVEPLGVDLRESAHPKIKIREKRATIQLAAAILDVGYDDLEQREAIRARRRMLWTVIPSIVSILIIMAAAYQFYDSNFAVKTQLCANYGERFGEPYCIGGISGGIQGHRSMSYRLTSQGGHVREMTRINGHGLPMVQTEASFESEDWSAGAANFQYAYDEDGALKTVGEYDASGKLLRTSLWRSTADPLERIISYEDEDGNAERLASGSTDFSRAADQGIMTDIGQHRLTFDENGRLIDRAFQAVGGGAMRDSNNVYGRSYAYDNRGLITEIHNRDANGEPLASRTGIAGMRRAYDRSGDLIEVSWIDVAGNLIPNEREKAARIVYERTNGNIARTSYFDTSGNQTVNAAASVSQIEWVRDAFGEIIERRHLDRAGNLIASRDRGYATAKYELNADGQLISESYFDPQGDPALIRDRGYARLEFAYDDQNRVTRESYFGIDGASILSQDLGVASVAYTYDESGNSTLR